LVDGDRGGEEGVLDVERWAELRREHFVGGVSIKELARRHGIDRNTVRRALRSDAPPVYRRSSASKLDPFKDEIHRLLKADAKLPGQRLRELLEPLGFDGGKTIVDDYLREVRPLFAAPPRTFQRTVYRPGEVCQFDVWEPKAEVPVGQGQTRRAWVVVACLGYSRAGAGALVFSKQTPDLLAGIARCLWSLGALPQTLVWDRQAGIHGHGGRARSSPRSAGSCASIGGSARRLIRRLRASSSGCRTSSSEASSRAGRSRTSWTSSCSSTRGSRSARTHAITRRCAADRSTGWQRNKG
jgi:hypothetical protein